MSNGLLEARKGIRLPGAVVPLVLAGNAGALPLFQISNWAQRTGIATVILKRIKLFNNAAGAGFLHIGIGAAGAVVDLLPALAHLNNLNMDFVEEDLPEVEFSVDIMGWSSTVPVDVQVEVEELS